MAETKLANTIARCWKLSQFGGKRDSGGANRRLPRTENRFRERSELVVLTPFGLCLMTFGARIEDAPPLQILLSNACKREGD